MIDGRKEHGMKKLNFKRLMVICFLAPIWGRILAGIVFGSESAAYDVCIKASVGVFFVGFLFAIPYLMSRDRKLAERAREDDSFYRELERTRERMKRAREAKPKQENPALSANVRAVAAELISVEYRQGTMETLGNALLGNMLLGEAGAFAGAATTPERASRATFWVTYASGRTGKETVKVGSERYRDLSFLVRAKTKRS